MIHIIGTFLAKVLIAPIIFMMGVAGYAPVQEAQLGATLPIAGHTYTLAGSGVSAAATSIILSTFTLPQSGYEILDVDLSDTFYITLEPGSRTKQEIVSCTTVTQNSNDTATLSGCTRGLLPISPYTADSDYAFAHGGGTSVIFSNPPQFYNEFAALDNDATITGVWSFPEPTIASSTATKNYVDDLVFGEITEASSVAGGFVELATGQEAASSTASGGDAVLVIPASLATSTAPASGHVVPVTGNDGNLAEGFLPATISQVTTYSGGLTSSGTTTLATTTTIGLVNAFDLGKNQQVFTASSTFSVPSYVDKVWVEVVGGGAGGGAAWPYVNGGGGGGAYCAGFVDVSATTSIAVTIGAGGASQTAGGASSFSTFVIAGGGATIGGTQTVGGAGGDCSGSTTNLIEIENFDGGNGQTDTASTPDMANSGQGGGSMYGQGGSSAGSTSTGAGAEMSGQNGQGYGAGGSGAIKEDNDGGKTGGVGRPGIIIVRW